jgi:hypothetical protein
VASTVTTSEQWFDEYLLDHGYTFETEPDLCVPTRPDRLIGRADFEAVCEVKEFTTDAMQRRWPEGGSRFGTFRAQEWFLNVRRTISDAAEQLEPLSGDHRPLVIVLANPHGTAVPIGDGHELMQAMYGELQITFQIDPNTGASVSEPQWELGEGRSARGWRGSVDQRRCRASPWRSSGRLAARVDRGVEGGELARSANLRRRH